MDKYYQILEVEWGATKEEIKLSYRDLIRVWHPDRFENDKRLRLKAEEKTKKINEAYEKISCYRYEEHASETEPVYEEESSGDDTDFSEDESEYKEDVAEDEPTEKQNSWNEYPQYSGSIMLFILLLLQKLFTILFYFFCSSIIGSSTILLSIVLIVVWLYSRFKRRTA
ncbi:MAG: DnaJ domain-containing protein [Candidatus Schekmanbacteria bacterium]|nr:DnaJ domain-containing protein [Candidatus Schekmanbacteria bacterium]